MKAPFYNKSGEKTKETVLPKDVFGQIAKPELIHQAVVAQQANRRLTIASTKDRSEVSGGGRKPWRQKGTGRARHGSIRSPIWVGGGITFGPTKERNFSQKLNRRMARRALEGALAEKAKDNKVLIIEDINLENPKTKEIASIIKNLSLDGSALLVISSKDDAIKRAARNLPGITVVKNDQLTAWNVLKYRYLIINQASLSELKAKFSKS
jgi:large subunit ribosomal protein L4